MLNSGQVRTIRVPLRKICSTLPALALISGGIVLSASAAPRTDLPSVPASNTSIAVPDIAMTLRAPGQILAEATPVGPPGTLGPELPPTGVLAPVVPVPDGRTAGALSSLIPAGTAPGSSSPVTLDTTGIPVRALEGYRKAASLVTSADPGCHIDWALIAAIGRVESNHARFGGNQLDAAGTARPGIIGMVLDGSNGTARITDTDNGVLDRDTVFDRAVGPMQFIPSTWRFAGIDANGDGVKNPENIADASAATAVYLCSGPGDLRRPADLHSAIWRYNASDSYVRMVTSIANAYRHGVRALPASDLTPTTPAASSLSATTSAAAKPAVPRPGSAAAKAATRPPAVPAPAKPAPGSAGTGSTAIPTPARPTTAPPATTTTTTTTTTTSSTTATSTAAPTTTTTTPAPTTPTPTTPVITITSTTCVPDPTATAGPVLATLDPSLPTPCPTAAPTP